MMYITRSVFICIFFNTGFLVMLCNANLLEQSSMLSAFNGNDTDFNRNWFTSQGDTIVKSMVFNIWFPIAMEFGNYCQRSTFRFMDWCSTEQGKKTAKTNIQQYINLHSGSKYLLHYRYSTILNVVFITMMFGAGMPILFPIAAMSLTCFFCLEKFMLYYVFQQPPAYDEKLNNSVLRILDKGPVFLLAFGYWLLTNLQQVENNYLMEKNRKSDPSPSLHICSKYWHPAEAFNSGPAGALLIMLYIYILYLIFRTPLSVCYSKCFPSDSVGDFFTDEEIDLYQNCLDDDDKNWSLKEEENSLKYGMRLMLKDTREGIESGKMKDSKKFHLQGVHTYDILRNPAYYQAF